MGVTKIWIIFQSIVFIGLGLFTFIKPDAMASAMGYKLLNATAAAELKAAYGGLLIAIGIVILLAAYNISLKASLLLLAIIYFGYACGRTYGVLFDHATDRTTMTFLMIELSSLVISYVLYYFSDVGLKS